MNDVILNLEPAYNVNTVMNDYLLMLILLKFPDLTLSEAEQMLVSLDRKAIRELQDCAVSVAA